MPKFTNQPDPTFDRVKAFRRVGATLSRFTDEVRKELKSGRIDEDQAVRKLNRAAQALPEE